MLRASLLTGAAFASAQVATLLWTQSLDVAVFTSAGLSRHNDTGPTFSTATWLNQPVEVDAIDSMGMTTWSFIEPVNNPLRTFMTDMSRHAERQPPGAFRVDMVAAEADFSAIANSTCIVRGFNSRGTNTPIWSITIPSCGSSLLYDSDRYIDISDDGSTAAFSGQLMTANVAVLWVINAQTGAVKFNVTLPAGAPGGPIMVTEAGALIAWTQGDSVAIINGTTGMVRDTVAMGWNTQAELSDNGNFLVFAGQDTASIYGWNAASKKYALKYAVVPTGGEWYSVSCSISSDGSGTVDTELVSFAWITETALGARVTTYSMVDGSLRTDWSSAVNAQLQTTPTVRSDGVYTGVALWGDNDDQPTAVVLKAGSNAVVFNYTTPGSMFGVDLAVDPAKNVLYFSVAGKHTPANEFGNGGDAYTWMITLS